MCLVTYSRLDKYSSLEKIEKFKAMSIPSPLWGYVEITSACSHKCPWCYGGFPADKFTNMSLDDFKVVLDKLKDIGIYQISLTGGEPTDHPQFREIIKMVDDYGFMIHLVSNGDNLTFDELVFLKDHNVKQIQFNWQGSKWHDKLHVEGSFEVVKERLIMANELGFETVTTTVLGGYNIDDLEDIFQEAKDCGASRVRVWDVIGMPSFMKGYDIKELFKESNRIAKKLGFNHTVSYDPEAEGDIQIKCVSMQEMFMHIKVNGDLGWCCVVTDPKSIIGNILTDTTETLLESYRKYSKEQRDKFSCSVCPARQ